MSNKAPVLARDMLSVEVTKGKKVGGRSIQSWNKRILGDVEWMNNKEQNDQEFLQKLITIGQTAETPDLRKEQLQSLMTEIESTEQAPRLVHTRHRGVRCEDPDCHHMFAEEREMRRHMRTCHALPEVEVEEVANPEYPFKCQYCTMKYKVLGWFQRHMAKSHPQIPLLLPQAAPPPLLTPILPPIFMQPPIQVAPQPPIQVVPQPSLQVAPVILQTPLLPPPVVILGPQAPAPAHLQLPPQDNNELVVPPGPPYRCPFRGCFYQCGAVQTILNHGASKHQWNLASCRPARNRTTQTATAARGAGSGT